MRTTFRIFITFNALILVGMTALASESKRERHANEELVATDAVMIFEKIAQQPATTTDADGVVLAAIQALKALVDEKDKQLAELAARVDRLEKARAAPYREVHYRVKNGAFEIRGRPGKFEKRVYPAQSAE